MTTKKPDVIWINNPAPFWVIYNEENECFGTYKLWFEDNQDSRVVDVEFAERFTTEDKAKNLLSILNLRYGKHPWRVRQVKYLL